MGKCGYKLIITNSMQSVQYTFIPAYLSDPLSNFPEGLVPRLLQLVYLIRVITRSIRRALLNSIVGVA